MKTPEKKSDELQQSATEKTAGTTTSPTFSEESDIHENPFYVPPEKNEMMFMDVTSAFLHTTISEELEVTYLSKVATAERQNSPLYGRLYGSNKRLMVNAETRRFRSRGKDGPEYPSYNIIFLCDTRAPNTYLCEEAMTVLLGKKPEKIPSTLFVQLANFPAVEAHLSPRDGRYKDVNVIGMDLLGQLQTTIFGLDLEFEIKLMTHRGI